jgi:hypothetical protein
VYSPRNMQHKVQHAWGCVGGSVLCLRMPLGTDQEGLEMHALTGFAQLHAAVLHAVHHVAKTCIPVRVSLPQNLWQTCKCCMPSSGIAKQCARRGCCMHHQRVLCFSGVSVEASHKQHPFSGAACTAISLRSLLWAVERGLEYRLLRMLSAAAGVRCCGLDDLCGTFWATKSA